MTKFKKEEPTLAAPMVMSEKESCKYCKPKDQGDLSPDCPYCQKIEKEDSAECPYCVRDKQDSGVETCQYCADKDPVQHPTTTDSEDFAGQDLNAPSLPKDFAADPNLIEQGVTAGEEPSSNNNDMLDPNSSSVAQLDSGDSIPKESVMFDQSKDALIALAEEIEKDGQTPAEEQAEISAKAPQMNQIDASQEAVGTEMEGNVSRPAGFQSNVPSDIGTSSSEISQDEDGPNLAEVFQGGLDQHADSIKREKVIQMASQALEGFKGCKEIIERSQQQAPLLYQSSIMMLKAMIEMARMLGLGVEQAPSETQNEWKQPFPTHSDNSGQDTNVQAPIPAQAPNEWAAPFATHPDNDGIGPGVGKLPTSATTRHVPRTPYGEGAINEKGQRKVTDPVTGEIRWINMREGRVLSPTGVPVKP